jgi:hypothetical protein
MIFHILDGGDAHLYPGITLPQKFDGILFDHKKTLLPF